MKTRMRGTVAAWCVALAITGCIGGSQGNGGGTNGTPVPPSNATTYLGAALVGELVSYTVDTARLTYGYTIVDSQYGLAGVSRTGTLARNSDGTYAPVGMVDGLVVIRSDGLMLGAIRESINGNLKTVPFIGTSNPQSGLDAGQATYNVVDGGCLPTGCGAGFGVFSVDSAGTWGACRGGNLTTGCCGYMGLGPPCSGTYESGTLNPLGGSRWQVLLGANEIGTLVPFHAGGRNVLLIDLKDLRAAGYGNGVMVGTTQETSDPTLVNGTWAAASRSGSWSTFAVNYADVGYLTVDGAPSNLATTFAHDTPAPGFSTWLAGGTAILGASGVYARTQGIDGTTEIGVRID